MALILIVDQLPKLTGVRTEGSGFFPQLASFVRHLPQIHAATTLFAAATLIFLFALSRYAHAVPAPLLALVLSTAAVAAFGLEDHGIAVIGEIPAGLPGPRYRTWASCHTCCCPHSESSSSPTPM